MDQLLQEFVSSRDVTVRVDRPASVIRGVKLLGLESRNGRRYLPQALRQAASLYEGAKVNVNHPKGHPLAARDYQDRLGAIRNVTVRDGQGLFGDLHFNPRHALAEQLLWDATHAPHNVGLSHNVAARTSQQAGETIVEAILRVQSVDLVADPATTRGLYENTAPAAPTEGTAQAALAALTLEQLHAGRPDLVQSLTLELQTELQRLQVRDAQHERRALAVRLLKEHGLPDPDFADRPSEPLVSELFLGTLLAAADETAMRALITERAALVSAVRRAAPFGDVRPISREQRRTEPARTPLDARTFAAAIQ